MADADYVYGEGEEDKYAIPFFITTGCSNNCNSETSYCVSQFVNIIS
jgi:hypothetical protein